MAVRVNTHALQSTTIHSARLGALGMIIHPMAEEGNYAGTVFQGGLVVASFHLAVDKKATNTQVNVDLASRGKDECECAEKKSPDVKYELAPMGYLVLYVSEGAGGYHVVLNKLAPDAAPRPVFDSRTLAANDQFVATILRPGSYEMIDELGKAKGKIVVAYPKLEKTPYRPAEPVHVTVTPDAFKPAEVTLGAAQSVVFKCETAKAAIKISLSKPDDGPHKQPPKFRWVNPRVKQQ
jgi:hypothetical protein